MTSSRTKAMIHYTEPKGSIVEMLRKSKALLSDKQYKELRQKVNDAEGYHEKKAVLCAYLKPITNK